MQKPLRLILIGVSAVTGVGLVSGGILYRRGGARLNRMWDVPAASLQVPDDEGAIGRGRHLASAVTLCTACHGDDLSGAAVVDEPGIAIVYGSNLTAGRGGTAGHYDDADYVRAIRHGVNSQGRGLLIMHSDAYQQLGAADLAAIIAYVKSVPPVEHEVPPTSATALGRIMLALGMFDSEVMPLIPAEIIDHGTPIPNSPEPAVTTEYGRYLASIALCTMCHGSDLAGGPPVEAGQAPVPSLATVGVLWTAEQFISAIRTGVSPSGRSLDPQIMPWNHYADMTDDELTAIWTHLAELGG